MGIDAIYQGTMRIIRERCPGLEKPAFLDIGPGRGHLIRMAREELGAVTSAADYTTELIQVPDQKVDVLNLNEDGLPYPDASFDIVIATEVIEHIEHYRYTLREIARVLKPGGLVVLSTPNILNLNSRLRFLSFGFWNLFGPLPVKHSAVYSTGGHINPVSSFFIGHALMDADLEDVRFDIDRIQRSSIPKLILLYPWIWLMGKLAWRREVKRYKTIQPENEALVRAMNTVPMLLGRTVLVSARKSLGTEAARVASP